MGGSQSKEQGDVYDVDTDIAHILSGEPVVANSHAPLHQPIMNTGHSAVHYSSRKMPRVQHSHYYFVPRMDHFVALDDPSKSKSLLYVKPGGRLEKKMAGRRLYYVKQSKKDRRIAAENAALDNENAEDAEYAEGDEQEQEGLDEEAPVVSPGAAEDPQNAPEGAGEHVDYFDDADLSAYDALPKVNEHADDLETDEDEDEAGDGSINNLECVLCATDGMVEPLISECKHICCNECWMTWLDETKDTGGVCPECEKPVDADTLYPVSLCSMCQSPPTDPWKAPCGHEGCKECWTSWVANTQDGDPIVACPSCSKDFPRAILPI